MNTSAPIATTREEARALINDADHILCDIDGCLISGSSALPGAAAFLDRYRDRLTLLSNNSTDTGETLSGRFAQMGLVIAPEQICLAGEAAISAAVDRFGSVPVLMLATPVMKAAAQSAGLKLVAHEPEAILVFRDTNVTFETLQNAVTWMSKGKPVILANRDLTHPGPDGPAIETGGLFELLKACAPPSELIEVGKPMPTLFHFALDGTEPSKAVMIGDNPITDIAGAQEVPMPAVQIGEQAGSVAESMAALLSEHGK